MNCDDSEDNLNLYVSQYEQKYQIASGAFASVFLIRNRCKKTKVLYAAKYLKVPQALADQEVEILVNLKNCQQVVSFVEVFHGKFYTILVTEYLSGGDLFERLSPREYQLTEDKCQLFVRQILQGTFSSIQLFQLSIENLIDLIDFNWFNRILVLVRKTI